MRGLIGGKTKSAQIETCALGGRDAGLRFVRRWTMAGRWFVQLDAP
jgi:hypothetical protein